MPKPITAVISRNYLREADAKRAREMADAILAFGKKCNEEEYIDTQAASDLLLEARRVLLRFTK